MSLKDTILRHIEQAGAQENPCLRVDPESGWIERVEPDRPVRPAKGTRPITPAPQARREKNHRKTGRQSGSIPGYDTFSLELIWPRAERK